MDAVSTTSRNRVVIAAVAAALVMTVAAARPAEGADPVATASASITKQVKKLKQQLSQLRSEVAALRGQGVAPAPAPPSGPAGGAPSGPAGGDLTGSYPNPLIGPDAVGTDEIAQSSVGSKELGVDSVLENEIRYDSVGSSELKGATVVVTEFGTFISPGNAANATVRCPLDTILLAGGFAWRDDESSAIIASAPRIGDDRSWDVRGFVPGDAGSDNRLYAWANCLER